MFNHSLDYELNFERHFQRNQSVIFLKLRHQGSNILSDVQLYLVFEWGISFCPIPCSNIPLLNKTKLKKKRKKRKKEKLGVEIIQRKQLDALFQWVAEVGIQLMCTNEKFLSWLVHLFIWHIPHLYCSFHFF